MDWIQVFTIIGVIVAFFYWIHNDISSFKSSTDGWIKHLTAMQAEQSKRTDKLNERLDQTITQFMKMLEKK